MSIESKFNFDTVCCIKKEDLFDYIPPSIRCNCRNCNAPVRLSYCEYCGTPYPKKEGERND